MAESKTRPSQERSAPTNGHKKQYTLGLPMMTIQVRPPDVHMPHIGAPPMPHVQLPHISRQELGQAVDIARSFMPPPERLAYYGALGALAVFGAIDWPVAVAIGAGAILAQRSRSGRVTRSPLRRTSATTAGEARRTGQAAEKAGEKAGEKTTTTRSRPSTSRSRTSTAASRTSASRSGSSSTSGTSAARSRTSAAASKAAGQARSTASTTRRKAASAKPASAKPASTKPASTKPASAKTASAKTASTGTGGRKRSTAARTAG
ncbi:hypothetical protein [Nonomuraea cavernae]|uniref:Uncharacterized protein n=1 Tax=Nonomuraea cavernae TaxID=2045107 RepID=A0A917YNX5_9ACTN|nr:hypothetical protein [Nonomuraea cavernae]MCA2183672.1 hypothetical protein [Nonomuraea cavernae]GGO61015.1 hypothetical protein GCM10012289_02240 [Nonomuraea cavernae]